MMRLLKIYFLLLSATLISTASMSQNIRGFYVNGFNGILGNSTSESKLLDYAQGNGFNYLCLYNVASLNMTSSTVKTQFAAFISKAKSQYGITQIGVSSETYSFLADFIIPYNQGRSVSEKVDVLNFEFELWNMNSITNLYCSRYLNPGGYSCDTAGAMAYAKNQFQQIDALAGSNGLISEMYFGWPNQGQMQWFIQRADRILLHAYRVDDSSVYSYSKTRLSYAGSLNMSVKVIPIFSSESSFMGPWLASHPITQPYNTYADGLAAETASWKQYINLQGYHWFKYTTMPATTTITASISAGGPTTFCTGGSVVLSANTGTGQTYQWYKNGSSISGGTGSSYTATASGSYTVKVTKSGSSATSSAVVVTVSTSITKPTISASGPLSFCPGGSVTLSSSSSTGNRWSTGATTQSITATSSGSYTVTVTSGSCSSTSDAAVVSTTATPPKPAITASGSLSLCPGTGITLTSSAASSGGYVWSNGATTRSIVATSAGTYWVRTGTSTCYSQSANSVATMLSAPAKPTISAGGSTNIGSSGSVTLTSSNENAYKWTTGSSKKSITVSTAGSYRVTVTGTNGCSSTSNEMVVSSSSCTPPPSPTISCSNSSFTVVSGSSVTLTASATTGGWLWSTGANTRSITVTSGGEYWVRNYNAGYCYSTSLIATVYQISNSRFGDDVTAGAAPSVNLQTYPNPSYGEQVKVTFNCEKDQNCKLTIVDLSGRIISEQEVPAIEGFNLVEVKMSALARGMYIMRLSGEDINETTRLTIQ